MNISVNGPLLAIILMIMGIGFTIRRKFTTTSSTTPGTVNITETPEKKRRDKTSTAYLVCDVEATCVYAKGFDWPNEIIEWPVVLLRWEKKKTLGRPRSLVIVDEFRSFVRPIWKPVLDPFCISLTGITQELVDSAPIFPEMLKQCEQFMIKNGLIDSEGRRLENFIWCTDGPWDIRDFLTKQLFISQIEKPSWLSGKVLDVRQAFGTWYTQEVLQKYMNGPKRQSAFPTHVSFRLTKQLELLGLEFEGREHSGIDDARNIARVMIELGSRGAPLRPNLDIIPPHYPWMGPNGTITGNP